MIRRVVIGVLSVSAIATGLMGLAGIYTGAFVDFALSDRLCGYLYSADGLLRLYWFRSDEGIYLSPTASGEMLSIRRDSDDAVCLAFRHASPNQIAPFAWLWRQRQIGWRPSSTTVAMSGFRTPVYLPVALLLGYPLFGVVRDRWREFRRPKRGFCQSCGYDLTGNASGTCPECGGDVRDLG